MENRLWRHVLQPTHYFSTIRIPRSIRLRVTRIRPELFLISRKKHSSVMPGLGSLVKIYKDAIERVDGNGAYRVLASDSSSAHGGNATCVIWDELWNQPSYDLWEALTHSPARENPFHFIVTYAGYQARSGNLLWDLYSRGMAGEDPKQYTFWRSVWMRTSQVGSQQSI